MFVTNIGYVMMQCCAISFLYVPTKRKSAHDILMALLLLMRARPCFCSCVVQMLTSHSNTTTDTKQPKFPPCRPICVHLCLCEPVPVWVFAQRVMLKLLHRLLSSRTQWAVAEQRADFECCWLGKPGPVSLSVSVCAPLNRNTHVAGLESNIVMPPFAKTSSKIFIFVKTHNSIHSDNSQRLHLKGALWLYKGLYFPQKMSFL